MSAHSNDTPVYRKLLKSETDLFAAHLLRLDRDSRHMRFGHAVSDTFIRAYAYASVTVGGVVHGCFINGTLRACAELRPASSLAPHTAEAAFSVEAPYQNGGIGTTLLRRLVLSARNRGFTKLVMYCLIENGRMRAVARKNRAVLNIENGEIVGEVVPNNPSLFSLMHETVNDLYELVEAELEAGARWLGAKG